MVVVSDTSPISNFWKINRLQLLRDLLGSIIVPGRVYTELFELPAQKEAVEKCGWMEVRQVSDKVLYAKLLLKLDKGEAEAITLAVETKADYLVVDELKGRAVAEKHGIKITGTLGLLLRAKEKGMIDSVKAEMDKLVYEADFWISPSLYQQVLELAGE